MAPREMGSIDAISASRFLRRAAIAFGVAAAFVVVGTVGIGTELPRAAAFGTRAELDIWIRAALLGCGLLALSSWWFVRAAFAGRRPIYVVGLLAAVPLWSWTAACVLMIRDFFAE